MQAAMRSDLEDLLLEIVALPPEQQSAALRRLCEIMPAEADFLRRWYLRHLQVEMGFGDDPGPGQSPGAAPTPFSSSIGDYRVLEVIGEGGMGTVYRAERVAPVRMQVAVKVIRRDMSSRQVMARFDLERRALAAMNHPCIARIFDAGTTEQGDPYFVMELVDGLAITTYCDHHRLTVRERLVLFQRLCSAVQHAHQKGVIHRDLKPGNVLVVQEGSEHIPKVLDFGLAKATALEDAPAVEATMAGQSLGTPDYMAPEQACGGTVVIDSRADIYALGVMLFQLLTGVLPFASETRSGGLSMLQAIANRQCGRPSATMARLQDANRLAALRRTTPATLQKILRRDLDWVVLKAMASEPDRRYESAAALAVDLQRFCEHEPVLAGPPSAMYRVAKFVRRHRAQVFSVSAVFLTAVVGGLMALSSAIHARHREADAVVSERRTEIANKRLGDTLAEEKVARVTAEARDYSARIAAAAAALGDSDVVAARRHLEMAPPEHRGFEWRYYEARLDESEWTMVGPTDQVRALAWDPFGRWFAGGSEGGDIHIWDSATHRPVAKVVQPSPVVCLDVSSDGARLLVTREGHSVAMLEVASGVEVWELPLPGASRAVWLPESTVFALSSVRNQAVQLWESQSGVKRADFGGHERGCTFVTFDRAGKRMLTAAGDHTIRVWDIATRQVIAQARHRNAIEVRLCFLGDGSQFAATCDGNLVPLIR